MFIGWISWDDPSLLARARRERRMAVRDRVRHQISLMNTDDTWKRTELPTLLKKQPLKLARN